MTTNNDHDFQQFRGAFDSAMMPDAEFKAKMEKLLKGEIPPESQRRTTSVIASPPTSSSATVVPTRRSHPLAIAAAVFTVFAVVVASVWVLSGDMLKGEYASAPSGIATMPADAPGTPGPDVHLNAERFPSVGEDQQLVVVDENVLVTVVWQHTEDSPDGSVTNRLMAQDAVSGEVQWELDNTEISHAMISEGKLIGYLYDWTSSDQQDNPKRELVAIDLKTGELLWEQESRYDAESDRYRQLQIDPIIFNSQVVIAEANGEIRAWDIETGDQVWESTFDPGEGWTTQLSIGEGPTQEVTQRSIAITEWNGQIVIANGDGTVHLLDPESGTVVLTHDLAPLSDGYFVVNQLQLYALPSGVLMVREPSGPAGLRAEILAFDPVSGAIHWEREFDGQLRVDVSNAGTIALNSHVWKEYAWYLRPFGLAGYSTFQFSWIDGETGEDILVTDRGKLEAVQITVTNGEYACTRAEDFVCFDRNGTRHIIDLIPWGDAILGDDAFYVNTEDGLFTVTLP